MRPSIARSETGQPFGAGILNPGPMPDRYAPAESDFLGIEPEEGNAPRHTLAELTDREASSYRARGQP